MILIIRNLNLGQAGVGRAGGLLNGDLPYSSPGCWGRPLLGSQSQGHLAAMPLRLPEIMENLVTSNTTYLLSHICVDQKADTGFSGLVFCMLVLAFQTETPHLQ